MDIPKIYLSPEAIEFAVTRPISLTNDVMYIRKDLVDKLKGYATHDRVCGYWNFVDCTCGLTEVLKEVGE